MLKSRLFSWTMQTGMKALTWQDRHFGNLIVDTATESCPHAVIKNLRGRGDILRTYMINGWNVVAHADVKALIRDKRLGSGVFDNRLLQSVIRASAQDLVVPLLNYPNMLVLDGAEHTRLRKATARSFTNRFVQSLAPKIRRIASHLLSTVAGERSFDLMHVVAKPLPAIVIAEMLGVPTDERHLFEDWSADLLGYTEILDPAAVHQAAYGDLAMREYLQSLIDHKRTHPDQGLISSMISTEADGDTLDVDELISMCTLLLVAGHETTTRLIGNCLLRLLQHPDQLQAVRGNTDLLNNAIEESLRLDPPVLALSRIVEETFEYQGKRFKKGQVVLLSIAGANRDPAVADDPDTFSIHRDAFDHISFGHGLHQCLGMPLARLEAKIALQQILQQYPTLTLEPEGLTWDTSPFFRGPQQLRLNAQTND